MALDKYKQKRDFKKTSEPEGKLADSKSDNPIFVVQRHAASRLHYDVRIEYKGVLVSWAVPKKPVHDPDVKRLAIKVEDHPLDYAGFAGDIPEGEYGAGHVDIWDQGIVKSLDNGGREATMKAIEKGLAKGHVHLNFYGEKLHGEYSLVKIKPREETKQDTWLFFINKSYGGGESDLPENVLDILEAHKASKNDMPEKVSPMLATLTDKPFDREGWIFEMKYDGYRAIAHTGEEEKKLYSRNGIDFKKKYPNVFKELAEITYDAIWDGEVVVFDADGKTNFGKLKNSEGTPVFIIFDVIYLEGYDLTTLSLSERKKIVMELIPADGVIRFADHIEEKGTEFFKLVEKQGLEGIIGKNGESRYQVGRRTNDWLKIKTGAIEEAFVVGYTKPEGSRKHFGSLLLAKKTKGELKFIGNVGTGFSTEVQRNLKAVLDELQTDAAQVELPSDFNKVLSTWVRPQLKVQVAYAEYTDDGMLRHPVFEGLAMDDDEEINSVPVVAKKGSEVLNLDGIEVEISNPDKIYWPEHVATSSGKPRKGYTKLEMVNYYVEMYDVLGKYLKDRPLSLNRFPNGIDGESFYQKDIQDPPPWVETHAIYSESAGKEVNYLICNNKATLAYLANLGSIELNPWHSRVESLDYPDYFVLDLDPKNVDFAWVIEVAQEFRKLFEKLEIDNALIKTSGKRGLHIYIPLGARYTYDQARDFAELLSTIVHAKLPDTTSIERSVKKRDKKIYLDYLQNSRGQTIAAPYSLRPTPEATVSTPLKWSEIDNKLSPKDYHIGNTGKRIAKLGDMTEKILTDSIDLEKVLNHIANL